jgi:hypothetical protein
VDSGFDCNLATKQGWKVDRQGHDRIIENMRGRIDKWFVA